MITTSVSTALLGYLIVTTVGILVFWLWHHWRGGKKKISFAEDKLTQCEFCTFGYLAPRGKKVSKCPQCGSFNADS